MRIDFVEIGNFRRLLAVRVDLAPEKTVFVGANNSGKTSAMEALRRFLVERERGAFSLHDFTLTHWSTINAAGTAWEIDSTAETSPPEMSWASVVPFLDVWLSVERFEAHYVQKLIPTLDWDGGRIGVRLRYEPKDAAKLRTEFVAARLEAKAIQAVDLEDKSEPASASIAIWPKDLTAFLQRRLNQLFTVKAYILDPAKLANPASGLASPQFLEPDAEPVSGEPFDGLIKIDEISAQRGFGHTDRKDGEEDGSGLATSATRRMSDQLRRYWSRHLDPYENPDAQDLQALKAIEGAERAFDDRLEAGFRTAFAEVRGIGYPGDLDPQLKIATRLRPIDGMNHEAAVQYMVGVTDEKGSALLPLPEHAIGLGYQNLLSMVFRLMSYRDAWMRVGKASRKIETAEEALVPPLHLVLIEEPEAYLHTQVQQVFIRAAYGVLRQHPTLAQPESLLSTQLVVSTHSSHLAHECSFETLRYFRRLPMDTGVPTSGVVNLSTVFGSDLDTKRFVTRYLEVTHCDLLFADAAVLVEGPAERILVPYFVRTRDDLKRLSECYITWLEIGGSHAHRLRPLIEQLGLTTVVITDIDAMNADRSSAIPTRGVGQKSRNATLKTWCPETDDIDSLLDMRPESKVKLGTSGRFAVRAAYQGPVTVTYKGQRAEALPNTLEDALIYQNLELFETLTGFGLVARVKAAMNATATINDLAVKLRNALGAGGKAEFALDLLELPEGKVLQPPNYIKEGLLWLLEQIDRPQKDNSGKGAVPALTPSKSTAL